MLNAHIESVNALRDADARDFNNQIGSLATALQETRAELARYKEHGRNLETITGQIRETYQGELDKQASYVARIEEDRQRKDAHIRYLEKLLQGIESGRVLRLTRTISRFLGRH